MTLLQETQTVHPVGEATPAGPWMMTAAEVVAGDEAASLVAQTNAENASAPDGLSYVAIRINVQNASDRPLSIAQSDFAVSGSDGILRRPPGIVIPDPPLHAVVAPGESAEGWVVSAVNDPATALLWYDSATIASGWGDAVFALAEGATLPALESTDGSDTEAGSDPARPAAIGETVRTGGWEVTVGQVIYGQDVFDEAGFELQALGSGYEGIGNFIGIYLSVRNVSAFPAYFSTSALEIADSAGEPWDHTMTLTPPDPDVSREYLPGASGEGWAAFEPMGYATADLIRILPYHVGGSPRYVAFTGGGASAEAAETSESTTEPPVIATGASAIVTEDLVNLRTDPSSSAEVIAELPIDTELTVTGEPVEADGYGWYPVTIIETGETGFVVADYLRAIEE